MYSTYRWIVLVGALLLAAMVGFAAWQAGVAHGIEQSGKIVISSPGVAGAAPAPYPYPYPYYGWHRPWGFGFFFMPFFFIFFWIFIVRGLFWRRAAWYGGYGGPCGPRGRFERFEEWHRQAHARDAGEAAPAGAPVER